MTVFRLLPLLGLLIALHGAPVAALEVGQRAGPVMLDPGVGICDTAEDAIAALLILDSDSGDVPESCGNLSVALPAILEVVGHVETAKQVYAILRIVFPPTVALGIQYGWVIDPAEPKGIKA